MKTRVFVLMIAFVAFVVRGEAYDPARHGDPIVVTEGTVEIDGAGRIIDGQGKVRCATLGPNVTLKNFTFRNGAADWGGGVMGGRLVGCTIENCKANLAGGAYGSVLENCTVRNCTASESGAALGDCTATGCTITGNERLLSSSAVAVHGGLVYGSTLKACTLTGNTVRFSEDAPVFGGLGEAVTLTECRVAENTVEGVADVCYGRYFAQVTIDGVSSAYVDTWSDQPLPGPTPPDPTPPGPTPGPTPGPMPDPPPVTDPFVGNATYVGWLERDGAVIGAVTVKATKAAKGVSKVTITVTPTGGKKTTVKTQVPVGEATKDGQTGLVFSGSGVSGDLTVGGQALGSVVSYEDPLKSTDRVAKEEAKRLIPSGVWTMIVEDKNGAALPFAVSVTAKTGKAKLTAYLADGTKVAVSSQGVFDGAKLHVPFVYSKKNVSFSFVFSVDVNRQATASGFSGLGTAESPMLLTQPVDGAYQFAADLPTIGADPYLTALSSFRVTPDEEVFQLVRGKFQNRKTVGSVAIKDGEPYVKYTVGKQEPANLSALKLTYAAKTGLLTGSCKLHRVVGGRLKKDTAKIFALPYGRGFFGLGIVNKVAFPVAVELVGSK